MGILGFSLEVESVESVGTGPCGVEIPVGFRLIFEWYNLRR